MVVIFYGTSAELIKMLGITRRIPREEQFLICTAQHSEGLNRLHAQVDIRPDLYLSRGWRGKDVADMKQMLGMMLKAHGKFATQFYSLRKKIREHNRTHSTKSIGIVHGDTLTTVVGAYMSRLLGLPVAHVEAGLRSGRWNDPFPEEMDRRIVSKIARVHFSPNQKAIDNLIAEKVKGDIVDTKYNTSKDALDMSADFISEGLQKLELPEHYCLVLLHRTELLENKSDLEAILKVVHTHASQEHPVVFTEHTTTMEKIRAYRLEHLIKKPGLRPIPKQPYFDYMQIVAKADYIVADSGGLQEDAYFLGVPIMIHRRTTERHEGLGLNAELSQFDLAKVRAFLSNPPDKSRYSKLMRDVSPSKIVIDYLIGHGYISKDAS
jgi:UDP-N-acetylglucosamine 2-epimerase (non-hydrolysing)